MRLQVVATIYTVKVMLATFTYHVYSFTDPGAGYCLSGLPGHLQGGSMSRFTEVLEQSKRTSVAEKIKTQLDEKSYEDFQAALADNGVSAPAIQRALKALGVTTSVMTIQRMRDEQ
jgi:hypothetical protein